jgi:pimeloyl-ACP methyl ester carboxylesterase
MTVADADSPIVRAGDAAFSYLEAGSGPPLVLLHGIGSAAASFLYQLEALSARFRVVAWDAPGYGASTPLAIEHPDASDYAAALDAWLGALGIDRCHLAGQSLGTLIAARFAAEQPRRVLSLTLASIARGHGRLPPPERQRLLAQRLDDLAQLGPHGMAATRGPRLLGPEATEPMRRKVIEIMARIRPGGYAQAARMLSTGDITADLARLPAGLPIQIVVGQTDAITPPAGNLEIATAIPAASVHVVPGAGHALYLEKPEEFNRLVSDFAATHLGHDLE